MVKILPNEKYKTFFIQEDHYPTIDSKKFYKPSSLKFLKLKCECLHLQQCCRMLETTGPATLLKPSSCLSSPGSIP